MGKARQKHNLSDRHTEALLEFSTFGTYWDRIVPGLRLRVGPRGASWQFYQETSIHGHRSYVFKTLGSFPATKTEDARKAALVEAGKVASGRVEPGKRTATKFGDALDAYLVYLDNKAKRKNKVPRHANNVRKLRKLHFTEFEKWPLKDLSDHPLVVKQWHERLSVDAGKISANRAAEALRACYAYSRKLNRNLPPDMPTSGVVFNLETASQRGLADKDFKKWASAWRKIENPVHRGYALANLLCGGRPGEVARIKTSDLRLASRTLVISGSKTDLEIHVPLSWPLLRAIKLAKNNSEYLFPGTSQIGHRMALPVRGNALRHSFKAQCVETGVDELLQEILMGHASSGLSRKYLPRFIASSQGALRRAQRDVSARIIRLLGLKVGTDF